MTAPLTDAVLEELRNIVEGYPLWPGDTLSHATAMAVEGRGWARRDLAGNWIPTGSGLRRYEEMIT